MKSRLSLTRNLLVACTMAMASSAAFADITVYTDRAAFLNAVSGAGTDNFDDLTMTEIPGSLNRMAGGFGYRVSAGPSDGGFWPSGSGSDIWLSGTKASDAVTFDAFSSSVFGFGGDFFGTDAYGTFLPGHTIVLSAVSGSDSQTFTLPNASQDSFVALVSDHPLTSVSFRNMDNDGNVVWAAANNVVLAVPEPAGWAMLLGGLGVAGLVSRRSGNTKHPKAVV